MNAIPSRGERAKCSGCANQRVIEARGMCKGCYRDPRLRPFAPMKKKFRWWTDAEVTQLIALRKRNAPVKTVAKVLGRTAVEVTNKSSRLGLRHQFGPPKGSKRTPNYSKHRCWICERRKPKRGTGWKLIYRRDSSYAEVYCPLCYPPGGFPNRPNAIGGAVGFDNPRTYRCGHA